MERVAVTSSNVAAIGYDEDEKILEVEFNNGSTYQYLGVPVEQHQALMDAPSVGKHLNTFIKGTYAYQPV